MKYVFLINFIWEFRIDIYKRLGNLNNQKLIL